MLLLGFLHIISPWILPFCDFFFKYNFSTHSPIWIVSWFSFLLMIIIFVSSWLIFLLNILLYIHVFIQYYFVFSVLPYHPLSIYLIIPLLLSYYVIFNFFSYFLYRFLQNQREQHGSQHTAFSNPSITFSIFPALFLSNC